MYETEGLAVEKAGVGRSKRFTEFLKVSQSFSIARMLSNGF